MRRRILISTCCAAVAIGIAWQVPGAAVGQVRMAPQLRTADGQPDIQGIWSLATITPLERPTEFAGKPFFTEKEAADYEKEIRIRNNMDRRDGPAEADVGRAYNDFWWDRGTRVVKTLRTSLVIDPADGKVPGVLPAARERQAERAAKNRGHEFDGPENRPLAERCIMWGSTGPPMLPTAYNNNFQIVQAPGYVTILTEMIHDARVIPLDGRPALPPGIRQYKGDSRGRWEGETLIVETTNYTDKTAFRGTTEKMRLTERFKRLDGDTLLYQFTVDDPLTFARPWTVEIPVTKSDGPIFEYACHEGNHAMEGGLRGARVEEQRAADEAKKGR